MGEGKTLTGDCVYRQKPRDGLRGKRGVKNREYFGIARDVSPEASFAFLGLVREIPRLSNGGVKSEKVKDHLSLKIVNRGLMSSLITAVQSRRRIEQKEINQMSRSLIQSLNGQGSESVTIGADDLVPHTIFNGTNRGVLYVSRKSNVFQYLDEANEHARKKIVEWTGSPSKRKHLEPRIDLYATPDKKAGFETVRRVAEIMREEEMPIVLEPAQIYEVPK